MLAVRNLAKRFGRRSKRTTIFDGVDLDVDEGSIVAITGANGSGKSTLLRCIAGLLTPDQGSIDLSGSSMLDSPRLAFVFDGPKILYPRFSVISNLEYFGALLGVPRKAYIPDATRIMDAMGFTGVDCALQELSRGTQQKAMIALALAARARLIVCDEPTSFLDLKSVEVFAEELKAASSAGAHVVVSTHDLRFIRLLDAQTYRLSAGRLARTDEPLTLPVSESRYVVRFRHLHQCLQFSSELVEGAADKESLSVEIGGNDLQMLVPYLQSDSVAELVSV